MLIFCEIWQAEVINHIPRPHQHTQPILLHQLEIVTMGSIPHELRQLVVHVVRLSKVPVPAEEVQAEHGGEEEAEDHHCPPHHHHPPRHPLRSAQPGNSSRKFFKKKKIHDFFWEKV